MPTATARPGFARFGAKTRDHRREAPLLLLLVLQSGAAVAVVWADAQHKNCTSDLWVQGIHTCHVEVQNKQPRLRSKQALTSTVSQ